ncbi:hypothetical protein ABKN59_004518 [Abortiporus biennis]
MLRSFIPPFFLVKVSRPVPENCFRQSLADGLTPILNVALYPSGQTLYSHLFQAHPLLLYHLQAHSGIDFRPTCPADVAFLTLGPIRAITTKHNRSALVTRLPINTPSFVAFPTKVTRKVFTPTVKPFTCRIRKHGSLFKGIEDVETTSFELTERDLNLSLRNSESFVSSRDRLGHMYFSYQLVFFHFSRGEHTNMSNAERSTMS